MHRFRCLAHAAVTGTALAMWLLVGWGIYTSPQPDALMRLPWFAALGIACITSGLALFPMVSGRPDDVITEEDLRTFGRAMYKAGLADAARKGAPKQLDAARPSLRVIGD
jgi:hypothetical protein